MSETHCHELYITVLHQHCTWQLLTCKGHLLICLDPKAFPTWHTFICLLGSLENVPLWLEQVLALCCLPIIQFLTWPFQVILLWVAICIPTHIVGFRVRDAYTFCHGPKIHLRLTVGNFCCSSLEYLLFLIQNSAKVEEAPKASRITILSTSNFSTQKN